MEFLVLNFLSSRISKTSVVDIHPQDVSKKLKECPTSGQSLNLASLKIEPSSIGGENLLLEKGTISDLVFLIFL